MQYKHTTSNGGNVAMTEQQVEVVRKRLEKKGVKFSKIFAEENEIIVEVSFDDDTDSNKEILVELGFIPKENRVYFVATRELPEEKDAQISFLRSETLLLQNKLGINFRGYSTIDSENGNLAIMVKKTADTDENRKRILLAGYEPKTKKFHYSISEQFLNYWNELQE